MFWNKSRKPPKDPPPAPKRITEPKVVFISRDAAVRSAQDLAYRLERDAGAIKSFDRFVRMRLEGYLNIVERTGWTMISYHSDQEFQWIGNELIMEPFADEMAKQGFNVQYSDGPEDGQGVPRIFIHLIKSS